MDRQCCPLAKGGSAVWSQQQPVMTQLHRARLPPAPAVTQCFVPSSTRLHIPECFACPIVLTCLDFANLVIFPLMLVILPQVNSLCSQTLFYIHFNCVCCWFTIRSLHRGFYFEIWPDSLCWDAMLRAVSGTLPKYAVAGWITSIVWNGCDQVQQHGEIKL